MRKFRYSEETLSKRINLISPYFVNQASEAFLEKTKNYSLDGISVGTFTSDLFTDFMDTRYTDREQASAYNAEALGKLAGNCEDKVMGNNANAYTLGYLSDVMEVPFDSNKAQIIDEVIPFYGMVLHGYKDFAGQPMNMSDDFDTMLLKSVECGAGICFEWIYEDNHLLKNTDFDDLYSVNYGIWKDKAVETWKKVNDAVGSVRGQLITEHEKLEDGVFATTYEDGTRVIVNYNKNSVSYGGTHVHAFQVL